MPTSVSFDNARNELLKNDIFAISYIKEALNSNDINLLLQAFYHLACSRDNLSSLNNILDKVMEDLSTEIKTLNKKGNEKQ